MINSFLKNLKNKILNSEFNKNVLILSGGIGVSQIIPVLISPILTRLYLPVDFGVLAIFVAFSTFIGSIACGCYEYSLIIAENEDEFKNLFKLSVILSIVVSSFTFLAIIFLKNFLFEIFKIKKLGNWIYLVPISVFLISLFNALTYANNRYKLYKDMSISYVYKSSMGAIIQLLFGVFKTVINGLIVGQIISLLVGNMKLLKNLKNKFSFFPLEKFKILKIAKKYKKFPTITLLNTLVDSLRLYGVYFMFNFYFNQEILGFYYLAWRTITLPLNIISSSFSRVFYKELAEKDNKYDLVAGLIKKLFVLSIIPFSILFLFGPKIFSIVFGEKWIQSGVIASCLSPWLMANFVSAPLAFIFMVRHNQEMILLIGIFYTFLLFGTIYFFNKFGFLYMLKILSFVMCIFLWIYIFYVLIYAKKTVEE